MYRIYQSFGAYITLGAQDEEWRCDECLDTPEPIGPVNKGRLHRAEVGDPDDSSGVCLQWKPVSGASEYVVQLSNNPSFSGPSLRSKKVSSPEYDMTQRDARAGQKVYWRVMAVNTAECKVSEKSEPQEVTAQPEPGGGGGGGGRGKRGSKCERYSVTGEIKGPANPECTMPTTYHAQYSFICKDARGNQVLTLKKAEWSMNPAAPHAGISIIAQNAKLATISTQGAGIVEFELKLTLTFQEAATGQTFTCELKKKVRVDCQTMSLYRLYFGNYNRFVGMYLPFRRLDLRQTDPYTGTAVTGVHHVNENADAQGSLASAAHTGSYGARQAVRLGYPLFIAPAEGDAVVVAPVVTVSQAAMAESKPADPSQIQTERGVQEQREVAVPIPRQFIRLQIANYAPLIGLSGGSYSNWTAQGDGTDSTTNLTGGGTTTVDGTNIVSFKGNSYGERLPVKSYVEEDNPANTHIVHQWIERTGSVWQGTGGSLGDEGVETKQTLTEEINNDGTRYSYSAGTLTVNAEGLYRISMYCLLGPDSHDDWWQWVELMLKINGSDQHPLHVAYDGMYNMLQLYYGYGNYDVTYESDTAGFSNLYDLSSGDTIDCHATRTVDPATASAAPSAEWDVVLSVEFICPS